VWRDGRRSTDGTLGGPPLLVSPPGDGRCGRVLSADDVLLTSPHVAFLTGRRNRHSLADGPTNVLLRDHSAAIVRRQPGKAACLRPAFWTPLDHAPTNPSLYEVRNPHSTLTPVPAVATA